MIRRLCILSILAILLSCSSEDKPLNDMQVMKTVDIDSMDTSYKPPYRVASEPESQSVPLNYGCSQEEVIGMLLPDLEDTTLLKLIYGSYSKGEKTPYFNAGPKIWDESDSVCVEVKERLGNDSVQVIYLRGEMAVTTRMHNHFLEHVLLVMKEPKGWKVADASIGASVIDYNEVKLEGFFGRQLLLQYETFATYAGGVAHGEKQYTLLMPGSLNGQYLSFVFESSNDLSDQCSEENAPCDCYSHGGKVSYTWNAKWKCLVFDYVYNQVHAECGGKNPKETVLHQKFCMSADTAFLILDTDDKIKLSEKEITERLEKARP